MCIKPLITLSFTYRDKMILPYDETRVHLKSETQYGDYVNASWVNLGNLRVISAQSPLPHTVEHFLQMIQENHVSVIVTLTREDEQEAEGIVIHFKRLYLA